MLNWIFNLNMPQLSIETFVSQYFWFISILLTFYYISITLVIPRISEIYKTRTLNNEKSIKNETTDISLSTITSKIVDSKETNNIIKISRNLGYENEIAHIEKKINQNSQILQKIGELWVKKYI